MVLLLHLFHWKLVEGSQVTLLMGLVSEPCVQREVILLSHVPKWVTAIVNHYLCYISLGKKSLQYWNLLRPTEGDFSQSVNTFSGIEVHRTNVYAHPLWKTKKDENLVIVFQLIALAGWTNVYCKILYS